MSSIINASHDYSNTKISLKSLIRKPLYLCGFKQIHEFFDTPNMVCRTRFHGGRDAQCLVNTAEIVVHKIQGHGMTVILNLFADPFVSRVKRRMPMRIVRFWRSTKLVEMCAGSGLPLMVAVRHPMQVAGLYRLSERLSGMPYILTSML